MALEQTHYRFGSVDGTEATHGWLAAEDRPLPVMPPGRPFLLRLCVQETGGVAEANVALQFQYRQTPNNGTPGAWTDITTTSVVARTGATAVFADGANCTKRLSGTGTFEASGAGCTHDGSSGGAANDIVASGHSETLIGLQLLNASTAIGSLIEFRVVRVGGTLLSSYPAIPSLLVGIEVLGIQSRDNSAHFSMTAAVSKIRNTLVTVECAGMAAADLADTSLTMTSSVWGTFVAGSTLPEDYTFRLYGPDVWNGGETGKDGMPKKPGFTFQQDIPEGIKRVAATFQPSRTLTFGADATIVEPPA